MGRCKFLKKSFHSSSSYMAPSDFMRLQIGFLHEGRTTVNEGLSDIFLFLHIFPLTTNIPVHATCQKVEYSIRTLWEPVEKSVVILWDMLRGVARIGKKGEFQKQ